MNYNYEIMFAISSILDTYSISKCMKVFCGQKIKNIMFLRAAYIVFYCVTTFAHLIIDIPAVMVICNILGLLFMAMNYSCSIKKRLLSVVFIYLILVGVETTVVLISGYQKLGLFEQGEYESVIGLVVIKLVTYVVALFLEKFKGVCLGEKVPFSYWFCVFFIPLSSLFLILQNLHLKVLTYEMLILEIIIFMVINFFAFYLYDCLARQIEENTNKKFQLQEQKSLLKQYEMMKSSMDSLRSLKHDLKNHFMTMQMLAQNGNQTELSHYIDEMVQLPNFKMTYIDTGNAVLDSILNFKLSEAETKGIRVDKSVQFPSDIELNAYDMTIILDNILDNAIEAFGCEKISLKIRYQNGRMSIKIANNFKGKLQFDTSSKLLSTKKEKQDHGIGLKNVEKIVEKYNGLMDINIEENIFKIYIMLYIS